MLTNRRESDVKSGLKLEAYPGISTDELNRNFDLFQSYDLDSTGFISPENMLAVLTAMEVQGASMGTVSAMIEEVAVLTGHVNDGKVTFRDFMNIVQHDNKLGATEEAAAEENSFGATDCGMVEPSGGLEPTTQSLPETEPETEPEAEPARPRRSSFSALNTLASSRIKMFQSVVSETSNREKLNMFKKNSVEMTGPMVNSDDMHMQSLRNKLQAFEVAATHKGGIERQKTWKKTAGAGNYMPGQKILLAGAPVGVAPRKKLSELP